MKPTRGLLIDTLHIFILCSVALAQPLFELLGRNAEFFIAHRSEPIDIVLLVGVLCVGLPTAVMAIEMTAGLLNWQLQRGVHGMIVAILVALVVLQASKSLDSVPGLVLVACALIVGLVAAVGYNCVAALRTFVTVLSPGLVLFPGLFVFHSPVSKLLFVEEQDVGVKVEVQSPAPVVMVIFDELPVTSLMDEHRQIDPIRYPNFAALAQDATWFRNATTVSPSTVFAVPAMVSGRYPVPSSLPTATDYPQTLFTLLEHSHAMHVFESLTMLCPDTICQRAQSVPSFVQRLHLLLTDISTVSLHLFLPRDLATHLPVITHTWKDFLKRAPTRDDSLEKGQDSHHQPLGIFEQFIQAIGGTEELPLYFLHILLPHVPWEYLPSGKKYTRTAGMVIPGLNFQTERWNQNEWLIIQGYQRHLLQVGFIDTLLGRLLSRLKETDLYARSLIVITADHGLSFRPNGSRRKPSKTNFFDIMSIPLIVKLPYQGRGVTSDRNVETIDILPTVADVLGVDLPWPVEGQSALSPSSAERAQKVLFSPITTEKFLYDMPAFEAKYSTFKKKLATFGSGKEPHGLFKIGPYPELVGRQINTVAIVDEGPVRISLDQAAFFADVQIQSDFIPAYITGRVQVKGDEKGPLHVAISINGIIQAVTETYSASGQGLPWAALVPEESFHSGRNEVAVFIVSLVGDKLVLRRSLSGLHSYTLTKSWSDGEKLSLTADGTTIPILPDVLHGWVSCSEVDDTNIVFDGWAVDLKNAQLPTAIVIFIDGISLYSGWTWVERPDVVQELKNPAYRLSGFHYTVPAAFLEKRKNAELRAFAISKSNFASELHYHTSTKQGGVPPLACG